MVCITNMTVTIGRTTSTNNNDNNKHAGDVRFFLVARSALKSKQNK